MAKTSEVVSRIKNMFRLVSKDMDPADRFILFAAQNVAESYISKRGRGFSLYRQDNLYQRVTCFDMESIDSYDCGIVEFKNCKLLMRSVKKLPDLIYSRLGNTLKEVTSIDNEHTFTPSTIAQARRDSKRLTKNTQKNFYVVDGYLYITNSAVESVNLYLISLDMYEVNEAKGCEKSCKSAWEYEFVAPSDLLEQVIRETASQLQIMVQIPEDESPNLNSNEK